MLQHLPKAIGQALRNRRPGLAKLAVNRPDLADMPPSIEVTSPAFDDGCALPVTCTADGDGSSPPLQWRGVPAGATHVVLMVEDADSPTAQPLVHAIVPALGQGDGELAEGALVPSRRNASALRMGRNSYLRPSWLPPDPPPGHGPHRYAFEVFALDTAPDVFGAPGRSHIFEIMRGHVLAKGCLIGTYERH